MKITKFVHSCLLIETPDRTVLFDPGSYSTVDVDVLGRLDDIFITHNHGDHMDMELMQTLVAKFPQVRVLATDEAVGQLAAAGIAATTTASEGAEIFTAPHEHVEPMFPTPQSQGIHYLGQLTHPGDSHNFHETKAVLALPVQAPWGSMVNAVRLALELRPQYIIPIHDWHWSDAARDSAYALMGRVFKDAGIMFIAPTNGESFNLD